MRRADRLFQLVQLLRSRDVVTAREIAGELEVSLRTVYRDVADLSASGVPIDGEAGVGYALGQGFDLPPLMFDREEIGALVLGARMVQAFGDDALADRAKSVLEKVALVVPEPLRAGFDREDIGVPVGLEAETRARLQSLREAIDGRRKIRCRYRSVQDQVSERTLRPLTLAFFGSVWLLGSWCELRADFRTFRPDRFESLEVLDEQVPDEPERSLQAYLRLVHERMSRAGEC